MLYVYDIILNFNRDLIEYFEWEDTDKIKYVKKIVLFKVSQSFMKDLVNKEIVLDEEFINKIPKYEMNGNNNSSRICLFSDGLLVVGVLIKTNKPILYSRLLLDEEEEILDNVVGINEMKIGYSVIRDKKTIENKLTRSERRIKNLLQVELRQLYKDNNYNKLKYLYYEYTNKECDNIDYIYKYLLISLNDFNDKHKHLNNILRLANSNTSKN